MKDNIHRNYLIFQKKILLPFSKIFCIAIYNLQPTTYIYYTRYFLDTGFLFLNEAFTTVKVILCKPYSPVSNVHEF